MAGRQPPGLSRTGPLGRSSDAPSRPNRAKAGRSLSTGLEREGSTPYRRRRLFRPAFRRLAVPRRWSLSGDESLPRTAVVRGHRMLLHDDAADRYVSASLARAGVVEPFETQL